MNSQCIDLNGIMRDSEQALRSTLGSGVDLRLETVPGLLWQLPRIRTRSAKCS